jgi:uncharacterized membrane protein
VTEASIDTMIGVEIAISLLPPASVIGIGLAFGRLDISRNALWLLVVNVIGLDILGSMLMLLLRGVRARYLALEKTIRKTVEDTVTARASLAIPQVHVTANVVLLSDITADIHATVHIGTESPLPTSLARMITSAIEAKTDYRSRVMVERVPCQTCSTLRPEDDVPEGACWSWEDQ